MWYDSYMKSLDQRITNIVGQLQGVGKMVQEKNPDCFQIIVQLKAAKSAISALMEKYLESEFDCCLRRTGISEKEQLKKIFSEVAKK